MVIIHSLFGLRVVLSHMVVKPFPSDEYTLSEFESSVISYGSQAYWCATRDLNAFESSVISYGS